MPGGIGEDDPHNYVEYPAGGGLASGRADPACGYLLSPLGGGLAGGVLGGGLGFIEYPSGGGLAGGKADSLCAWAPGTSGGGLAGATGSGPASFVVSPSGGGLASSAASSPAAFAPAVQGGGLGGGPGTLGGGSFVVDTAGGGLAGAAGSATAAYGAAGGIAAGGGLAGGKAGVSGGITSGGWYNIYGNSGAGAPIDYTDKLAVVDVLTWTSWSLAYPAFWKWGVRAENEYGEERNVDAIVITRLDAGGVDITAIPDPPTALSGRARSGATVRLDVSYQLNDRDRIPVGIHLYAGTGGSPSYGSPVATIPYLRGVTYFAATVGGLTDGVTYTFGARAYNAAGEETNTDVTCTVTADATAPPAPWSLTGDATA